MELSSSSSGQQLSFPQLHVPPVPNLVAVPPPKPVKRLPPVGYDMRTLRQQMDTLYQVCVLGIMGVLELLL